MFNVGDLEKQIEELASIVPEWLSVKDFKGRLVKCVKSVSS
jgi:hypothetical protein